MNWKLFWNDKASESDPLAQVARIQSGKPMEGELLQKIAEHIAHQLELQPTDDLLDVCCGNGVLTKLISAYCRSTTGVDISTSQIEHARRFSENAKISLKIGDASSFQLNKKFDKIVLYFSFQYFESYELGKKVIANLCHHIKPGGIILLGDIPDKIHLKSFYPSLLKQLKYRIKFALGRSDMGKFWSKEELDQICSELKVSGNIVRQDGWQPYSDYRFDYLITLANEI